MAIIEVDTVFGPFLVREGDLITQHIQTYGAHTRTDLAFLLSVVAPGDDVFDLGAHVGSFAVPLARKTGPTGRVLAVEGNPDSYALLRRNLALSGGPARCEAINAVVASDRTLFRLIENARNSGASYFEPGSDQDRGAAAGRPLGDLVRAYFTPRVVKLDIEGFEYAVLSTLPLAEIGNPILFAEVSGAHSTRAGSRPEDLERLLRDQGYRCFWNRKKSHAHDDVFSVIEIRAFGDILQERTQFNVLAIHREDDRLPAVLAQAQ